MDNGKPAPALGIFLLFFLLTPVDPKCIRFTAVECKAAQLAASHFDVSHLGFDVVGLGTDITTMENTQGTVLDMNSWEDTNGNCTVCTNTLLEEKPVQFLPLAISEWNITEESCIYDSYNMPSTLVDFATKQYSYVHPHHMWNEDLGLQWKSRNPVFQSRHQPHRIYYFAGTHSKIMKFVRQSSTSDKGTFFHYEIKCKKYRVRTRENPTISEALKEAIKKLPPNHASEYPDKVLDLIRIYGTHYLVEAELGGVLRSVVNIRYCKLSLNGFSMHEVRECLRNYIRSALGMSTTNDPTCVRLRSLVEGCNSTTWGGNRNIDLCQMGGTAENYQRWQKELRVSPGLITYKLKPIHLLLDEQDPQRPFLKSALKWYINRRSMSLACTNYCPLGDIPKWTEICSCKCDVYDGLTKDDCCPKQIGISRVKVWIHGADGLRGDWFSEADTYVEVELFGDEKRTDYVWNSNNPVFNRQFDFGAVPLIQGVNRLYITVKEWNPYPWGETITDSFAVEIGAGELQRKYESLSHGHLDFSYEVVCGPYLTGHNCREYKPQQATYDNNFQKYYRN